MNYIIENDRSGAFSICVVDNSLELSNIIITSRDLIDISHKMNLIDNERHLS